MGTLAALHVLIPNNMMSYYTWKSILIVININ